MYLNRKESKKEAEKAIGLAKAKFEEAKQAYARAITPEDRKLAIEMQIEAANLADEGAKHYYGACMPRAAKRSVRLAIDMQFACLKATII